MSDEKNLNEENINEESVETAETETVEAESAETETVVEENADAAEELADEVTDDGLEDSEVILDGEVVNDDELGEDEKDIKKLSKKAVVIIVAVIIVVLAAVGILYAKFFSGNKYNKMYVDTTGRTVGQVADEAGMSLEDFLEEYDLPKNMPEDTYEAAAFYTMPFKTVVEKVYGTDMDTAKEQFGITDDIADDATYVEVMDKVPLKNVVATSMFDSFKEFYGFGDEVTEDTLYGEVRQAIDEKEKAERIAEENEENDAAVSSSDDNSDASADTDASADVDTDAAPDASAETAVTE